VSLRVATFNLLDLFEPELEAHRAVMEAKLRFIGAELVRARADVVAFQEVGSEALLGRLLDEHAAKLGYVHRVVGTGDRRGIRCAIVSRRPLVFSAVHRAEALDFPRLHVGDPAPFAGRIPLRRGVVHVRVEDDALGRVDVLTAHFKSKLPRGLEKQDGTFVEEATAGDFAASSLRSLVLRAAEALYVRRLVDGLLQEDRHVCVLGDLNDTLDSLPVRVVRGAERGVDPAYILADATRSVPAAARRSVLFGGRGEQIDHVLVSPALAARVRGAGIQNEALRDFGPFDPDAAPAADSDHALVWVELG
jgi:endonuclease/exonuclease/phosphatase family metal-dependent hydrolase